MNCIPGSAPSFAALTASSGAANRVSRALYYVIATLGMAGCNAPASETADPPTAKSRVYHLEYSVRPEPQARGATVEMRLRQPRRLLREVRMSVPGTAIRTVDGDGELSVEEGNAVWRPAELGGTLQWFVDLRSMRGEGSYDAYIDSEWAVFRAEDIIPRAATRSLKGARSKTTLTFDLPKDWSAVTEYFERNSQFAVNNPERRFDLPGGWIALGNLGVRNETIAGKRVKIAGPAGHAIRRMDMLALLRWTLPELSRILPDFPDRLTIVSAGDPMWRGGLSAPQSLFIHADRPLLSENATSTLLHEIAHIGLGMSAENGADWIVEGLAEYYSLQALRRSGTISEKRFAASMAALEQWGTRAVSLCGAESSGEMTARAVGIFQRLDAEISDSSDRQHNLDDVIGALAGSGRKITIPGLREAVIGVIGNDPSALSSDKLAGCAT